MKENQIKSLTKLAGLGAGIYYANKLNKGILWFVGYGILGMFAGSVVGGLVSKSIMPPPTPPIQKK